MEMEEINMEKPRFKTHFTRKNFIALAIVYFYLLVTVFSGLCLDAKGLMKEDNPIQMLGKILSLPSIDASFGTYILFSMVIVYSLLFAAAFIYEMRLAKYYEEKAASLKWIGIYVATFFICLILASVIGIIAHIPVNWEYVGNSFLFVLESLFVGLIIFIILGSIVLFAAMLVINLKSIDKPFRFFNKETKEQESEERKQEEKELNDQVKQGHLAETFGEVSPSSAASVNNSSLVNQAVASPISDNEELTKEKVFPSLCEIDVLATYQNEEFNDDITLPDLVTKFRNYLAKEEKLYFDINTIRCFISALSASRLIILEGLSGTGKSSLARYFSEFISEESFFTPVQATWRDRTSLLGYYNDFSKSYNETEFLKRLYQATYRDNHINIMVLDEMNISRVEYYFADFLSILEYPIDQWKLKIMNLPFNFTAPDHLENGILDIAPTTYFIGTANKDDSTYTITDKVYDRAITISFNEQNDYFPVEGETEKITLSYSKLQSLFSEAQNNEDYQLSKDDLAKFKILTDYIYETFDVTFGNRILNQIILFTPVFVAAGGRKEDALDFMLCRKILNKLDGRFEDYVEQGLEDLLDLINKTYSKEDFTLSKQFIKKLLRRF